MHARQGSERPDPRIAQQLGQPGLRGSGRYAGHSGPQDQVSSLGCGTTGVSSWELGLGVSCRESGLLGLGFPRVPKPWPPGGDPKCAGERMGMTMPPPTATSHCLHGRLLQAHMRGSMALQAARLRNQLGSSALSPPCPLSWTGSEGWSRQLHRRCPRVTLSSTSEASCLSGMAPWISGSSTCCFPRQALAWGRSWGGGSWFGRDPACPQNRPSMCDSRCRSLSWCQMHVQRRQRACCSRARTSRRVDPACAASRAHR